MTESAVSRALDGQLWVWNSKRGRGLIAGRGSRHPGSFLVLWGHATDAISARLTEIEGCSEESSYWLRGMLAGTDLPPWFGPFFDSTHIVDVSDSGWSIEEDSRYELWRKAVARFEKTGVWRYPSDLKCKICGRSFFPQDIGEEEVPLPSDPAGDVCLMDDPIDLDTLWPRVGWLGPVVDGS